MSVYPTDLIPTIREKCAELDRREYSSAPPLPADAVFQELLDTAFHASFLSEEGRRPGFRIIFLPPTKDFSEPDRRYFENAFRKIPFERSRSYTAAEINRLAPAAELTRLLICVHSVEQGDQPQLAIWGLLDVGENWWRFVRHETSGGKPPPNALTITSLNPGEIVVSAQGEVLVSLRSGAVCFPETTALWDGPVSDFLEPAKRQLHDDAIVRLNTTCWDERGYDEDYPQRLYVFFLERILFNIRERRHGGTLIMLPSRLSRSDTRITDRLFIKYPCDYNCVWDTLLSSLINHRRYYDRHFPLWDARIAMTQEVFQEYSMLSGETEEIDEALTDQAQAIACLSSVDGAVVINDRFTVLGFGAEVTAVSPTLTDVMLHTGTQPMRPVPIESFGTRHRSAFRLCSSFEDTVGFVVSQDGGVKAVKRVGSDVVLWPDINPGTMGI